MTEGEANLEDRRMHILKTVLPAFASRHNIDWHYSDGLDNRGMIRYKPIGYRIDWHVKQDVVIAEVRAMKRLQEYDVGDSLIMFSFGIHIDEIYDWLDDYHFMRLQRFVFDHIELYWDCYQDIINHRVWHTKLDGRLAAKLSNIETEGALLGML